METRDRGVLRFVDFYKRLSIEGRLEEAYSDLYEAVDEVSASARELQGVIGSILYGEAKTDW